jgi:hypothetical protein
MVPAYEIGDTFFGTTVPGAPPHLYVIISNPDPDGNVILVNLTSQTLNDRNCLLSPGDHPFVAKETAIAYDKPENLHPEQIKKAIQSGIWRQKERFRPEVLRRIQDGALQSDDFFKKFRLAVQSSLVSMKL